MAEKQERGEDKKHFTPSLMNIRDGKCAGSAILENFELSKVQNYSRSPLF